MKILHIYTLISGLSLATCFTLSAADPSPAKKAASAAKASTTTTKAKPASKKTSDTSKSTPATPTTHTVKKGLFEIKVELSGIFDAVKATQIAWHRKNGVPCPLLKPFPTGQKSKRETSLSNSKRKKLEKAIPQS